MRFSKILGYLPHFYVSLPENKDLAWAYENILEKIEYSKKLPYQDLVRSTICQKLKAVGFTNEEKSPFLLLEFRTMSAYYAYRKAIGEMYPAPTREDIESKIFRNDVMLCEAYANELMKFYDKVISLLVY